MTTHRIEELESALREIASFLSVGGYNADIVDVDVYVKKIKKGINDEVKFYLRWLLETLQVKRTGESNIQRLGKDFCEGYTQGKSLAISFIEDLLENNVPGFEKSL